jgi:death-on-curing protein
MVCWSPHYRVHNLYAYQDVSVFDLAACYAEGIAHNHPFIDGNKRTWLGVAGMFLEENGYHLDADQKQLADMMVALAEKKIGREELAEFFRISSAAA